jgi:hypothetical protein
VEHVGDVKDFNEHASASLESSVTSDVEVKQSYHMFCTAM